MLREIFFYHFNDRFSIFGRYNYAPSSLTTVFSEPSNPSNSIVNTKTLTGGVNMSLTSRLWNTVRANYSTQSTSNPSRLTSFGGAVPLDPALLLGSLPVWALATGGGILVALATARSLSGRARQKESCARSGGLYYSA